MGLLPQEATIPSGRILFDGQDIMIMNAEERRRLRGSRIGLIFQDPFSVLNPSLRIGDQVGEGWFIIVASRPSAPSRERSSCSTRSASSSPRPLPRPTLTNCRAACASAP